MVESTIKAVIDQTRKACNARHEWTLPESVHLVWIDWSKKKAPKSNLSISANTNLTYVDSFKR